MTDNSWEQYGMEDPYFGVLTDPKFRLKNLNEQTLQEFFESGETHVAEVIDRLGTYFPSFKASAIKTVLDFGCGTGRLLIPFAKRYERATGVDLSKGMLAEAEKNSKVQQLSNVSLLQTADISSIRFEEQFDLVHTFIVLQHIPVKIGYGIIDTLLKITRSGGYGMIHLTYANNRSRLINQLFQLRAKYKLALKISNLVNGKRANHPLIQMNSYDLPTVLALLRKHGVKQTGLDYTDHDGFYGVSIYFSK